MNRFVHEETAQKEAATMTMKSKAPESASKRRVTPYEEKRFNHEANEETAPKGHNATTTMQLPAREDALGCSRAHVKHIRRT